MQLRTSCARTVGVAVEINDATNGAIFSAPGLFTGQGATDFRIVDIHLLVSGGAGYERFWFNLGEDK